VTLRSLHFIGEKVEVFFDESPTLEKKPPCPTGFVWRGDRYRILENLGEWHDYTRKGRMARNMRPEHAATASIRGSWGVGRDYFCVRTDAGRIFELYYDRAPKGSKDRKGSWMLFREMSEEGER
jgi:hypothetical protein